MSNLIPTGGEFELIVYDGIALGPAESFTTEQLFVQGEAYAVSDVTITLVWSDPAASADCTECLIHDLDLVVTHNGGRVYSNFGASDSSGMYYEQEDDVNNVEIS